MNQSGVSSSPGYVQCPGNTRRAVRSTEECEKRYLDMAATCRDEASNLESSESDVSWYLQRKEEYLQREKWYQYVAEGNAHARGFALSKADGLEAVARVGVPGEHGGILNDHCVFRMLNVKESWDITSDDNNSNVTATSRVRSISVSPPEDDHIESHGQ
ncbi:hypothetical protein Bca52824_077668 [Brassica carinata]|uniref:Uncharacterized protein n=1 Tax=Brassica carinata TaxID=52824 RepID=A0A8X7TYF1_BRACI|nr:hypothetical protein Bca52824_077668 [Brassica carinata]